MIPEASEYRTELNGVLPSDLPNRARVAEHSAIHLHLLAQINVHMNLTRVVSPREAAVKHVLDSVIPWRLFESFGSIFDIGTGAGFPGVPLALAFPEKRFTLAESIRKKAQFVSDTVDELPLPKVDVVADRAENVLRERRFQLTIARAVSPVSKLIQLLGPSRSHCGTILLYKGPGAQQEIAEAQRELNHYRLIAETVLTYDLPYGFGQRLIIRITPAKR